jgi:hypothetical protein
VKLIVKAYISTQKETSGILVKSMLCWGVNIVGEPIFSSFDILCGLWAFLFFFILFFYSLC